MRPLTDTTPKPMLPIDGKPLLEHHINRLAAAGITEIVINTCWLGEQIEEYFNDGGQRFGVKISWSREAEALETGGGICQALPLLGDQPFLLINGDVWSDFPLASCLKPSCLQTWMRSLYWSIIPSIILGVIFHCRKICSATKRLSDIPSVVSACLGQHCLPPIRCGSEQCFPLRDVLRPAILAGRVGGSVYTGSWCDVGTVERYQQLQTFVKTHNN